MKASFAVSIDTPRSIVNIKMSGFFTSADITAFTFSLRDKMNLLRCDNNQHLTLCDVREMEIQTQEMVALFSRIVGNEDLRSKRLAFVTGATLARLQTRRLTDRPGVVFFHNSEDAEEWLISE